MNFYQKRRRTPVLQIISMIDILIILLIFLVVSTSFKELNTALNVSLPSSREMTLGAAPADGRLSLTVTREEKIHLADAEISAEDLPGTLARMKADRPDTRLELRMDEKVSLGLMMRLWDALTKAGFKVSDVPVRALRVQDGK